MNLLPTWLKAPAQVKDVAAPAKVDVAAPQLPTLRKSYVDAYLFEDPSYMAHLKSQLSEKHPAQGFATPVELCQAWHNTAKQRYADVRSVMRNAAGALLVGFAGLTGLGVSAVLMTNAYEEHQAAMTEYEQTKAKLLSLMPAEYQAMFASEFLYVQGGPTQIGSSDGGGDEVPIHQAQVSPFAMQKTEMTNEQYEALTGLSPSPSGFDHPKQPVVNVTWYDADAACRKLGGRLPTEAEWELVATNYGKSKWALPEGVSAISAQYANYADSGVGKTNNVASYLPNPHGFHDLSGNVSEWVSDWYGLYQSGLQVDPTGPQNGNYRIIRGGDWVSDDNRARGAYRGFGWPSDFSLATGFRCALSPRT